MWKYSNPSKKSDLLDLVGMVPDNCKPDLPHKTIAQCVSYLHAARNIYYDNQHAVKKKSDKRKFSGINANECNAMLRDLPPPLLVDGRVV